mgnify:FL=1
MHLRYQSYICTSYKCWLWCVWLLPNTNLVMPALYGKYRSSTIYQNFGFVWVCVHACTSSGARWLLGLVWVGGAVCFTPALVAVLARLNFSNFLPECFATSELFDSTLAKQIKSSSVTLLVNVTYLQQWLDIDKESFLLIYVSRFKKRQENKIERCAQQ